MAGVDGHPHAGHRHGQVGDAEDLAALVAELVLLVGLVVDRRRRRWDSTLKAIGPGKTDGGGIVDGTRRRRSGRRPCRRRPATCSSSSAVPARPGARRRPGRSTPTSRRSPAASACSGASTGMQTMVVQLGLATMPFGMRRRASALTSGTTSGTVGVHAPGRGVVDDDGARGGHLVAQLPGRGRAHGEQGHVDAGWSAVATSSTTTPSRSRPGRSGDWRRAAAGRRGSRARSSTRAHDRRPPARWRRTRRRYSHLLRPPA